MAYSDREGIPANIENKDKLRNSADLLPMYFRTEANKKFLGSTIDSLISKGNLTRLNGFVGERNTNNAKPSDVYIEEPTDNRRRYNFLPSAVTKNPVNNANKWTGTYDDLINQINFFGGNTVNHNRLFESEYYAWNPLFDFDKFVNYRQYYWLTAGASPVQVSGNPGTAVSEFTVTNNAQGAFVFTPDGFSNNPTVKLYRGGTYKFKINAPGHPFNIKTALTIGIGDRYSDGVENNGVESGTITFTVPLNAPDRLYYACQFHQSMQGFFEIKDPSAELSINVENEIIGKRTFTSKNGVELSNGMKIEFVGDVTPSKYRNKGFYVEGVGKGIVLIDEAELDTPEIYSRNEEYEFDVEEFDDTPFADTLNSPLTPEYVTINRASKDKNPWSRYNRWVHKSVIEKSAEYNNTSIVLDENNRAVRPILEFKQDLKLINFGESGIGNVDLIDTTTTDAMSLVEGSFGYYVDEVLLRKGMRVIFNADPDITVKGKIYEVDYVKHNNDTRVHLIEKETPITNNSVVIVDGKVEKGTSWYFDGTAWIKGQQKTTLNQSPLFDLFDNDGVSFSDNSIYEGTNFVGNTLASYKRGTGGNDPVLGFPISYQNVNNVGDITFEFNWDDGIFTYQKNTVTTAIDTASGLVYNYNTKTYENGWELVEGKLTKQNILQVQDTVSDTVSIPVDCIKQPYLYDLDIIVEIDGKIYKSPTDFAKQVDTIKKSYTLEFVNPIPAGKRVTVKVFTDQPANQNGYYEPPINLTNNSENNDLKTFTLGSVSDHFNTIFLNNSDLTGTSFGQNNSRDLEDIHKDGTRYIKHKGSILPALLFLLENDTNFVNAIRNNAKDYAFFKDKFIEKTSEIDATGNVANDLDTILFTLGANKQSTDSYFYSDMAGYGKKVSTLTYTVKNGTQNVFAINTPFDTNKISDRAVYVYLNNELLFLNDDYLFDKDDNTVTISKDLAVNDIVEIRDYDTTGNAIPHTPSKLGLYPLYKPSKFIDNSYLTPTTVIQGHDGSVVKAFGDDRDNLILEFEKRIYNNVKVQYNRNVFDINKYIPGFYRNTGYTRTEFDKILRTDFGYWQSLFNIDSETNTITNETNPFSYNYKSMTNQQGERVPGYWRGIYKYYFDTDRPHTHPWEMLGFTVKPSWWENKYGAAPYTSGNKILWDDLEKGYIADPSNLRTDKNYIRKGLSKNIPVDEYGDLKNPATINIIKAVFITEVKGNFKFGDHSPAESSWRKSSWYPFAIQIGMALSKPAQYFGSLFDTNQNKVLGNKNTIYKDTGKIISLKDVSIKDLYYNNVRFLGTGYHVFISEYLRTQGKDVKLNFSDVLKNTSMNLAYKLGGFANKNRLRVLAESSNPNTADNSIFLPSENYQLTLRKSNPVKSVRISGIIVEKTNEGFLVRGYDKFRPWFNIYQPVHGQNDIGVSVGGTEAEFVLWAEGKFYGENQIVEYQGGYYRVKQNHTSSDNFDNSKFTVLDELPISGGIDVAKARTFATNVTEISYGTVYTRIQDVYDVIQGYGKWLESEGFTFNRYQTETLQVQNWDLSGREFLFWVSQGWAQGSVIALSPFADELVYEYKYGTVDNVLNSFYEYTILSANGNPIPKAAISIARSSGKFTLNTVDTRRGVFFAVLNLVQWEHLLVLDDKSQFGDIMYDQEAGYRQKRIRLIGFKTSEWDGDYMSPGFIFDEAIVQDWLAGQDYNLGDVIRNKGKYYSARKFIPGKSTFDFNDWVFLGDKPVAELLPNLDYKAGSFEDFYALESENFDSQTTELAQHLVGYQKRLYLDNMIRDEVAQYKFYTGYIREKGTKNAIERLNRLNVDEVSNNLTVDEHWAIKVGSLGSGVTIKEIELPLKEAVNVENPQGYKFVDAKSVEDNNIQQLVSGDLTLKPADYTKDVWPTYNLDTSLTGNANRTGTTLFSTYKLPFAGYVRPDDVTTTLFDIEDLLTDSVVATLNEGDTVWVAKDKITTRQGKEKLGTWNVYRLQANPARLINPEDNPVSVTGNVLTLHTDIPHGLSAGDKISVKQFDPSIDGMYSVISTVGLTSFTVATELTSVLLNDDSATGTILGFDSVRVGTPGDLNNLKNLSELEVGAKVWLDSDRYDGEGIWKVYEKTDAFKENSFNSIPQDAVTYGHTLAYGDAGRMIIVGQPNRTTEGSVSILRRSLITSTASLQGVQGFGISENISDSLATDGKFGSSISVSSTDTTIAIGAPEATNGRQFNDGIRTDFNYLKIGEPVNSISKHGAVKVMTYNTLTNLYETNYVVVSPRVRANENFGTSVAVSDTRLVVGAPGYDFDTGKIYIYKKGTSTDGSTLDWEKDTYEIVNPTNRQGDRFGEKISATKDLSIIVVTAPYAENESDDSSSDKGRVYIYKYANGEYNLLKIVTGTADQDLAGSSVAISDKGETIIIGNPLADLNEGTKNSGSVTVLRKVADDNSSEDMFVVADTINNPSRAGGEQFGTNVAVNPDGSAFAVASASGSTELQTSYDTNTTTYDAKSLQFVDQVTGTGSVYTYSKITDESVAGNDYTSSFVAGTATYVFGQKLSSDQLIGKDAFGNGLAYSSTSLYVGAPYGRIDSNADGDITTADTQTGRLFVYQKVADAGWNEIRKQDSFTNPFSIAKAFTYRTDTQTVVDYLETIDPIKGKIPYIAEAEINYKSEHDPAVYTTSDQSTVSIDPNTAWADTYVGEVWWDLSTLRYQWYEQGDAEYRKNNWGTLFPGSTVDVYEWVESNLNPTEWNSIADTTEGISQGFSGQTKYDENTYVLKRVYDKTTNSFVSRYYYWVKNSVIIPERDSTGSIAKMNRKLPTSEIASIIASPQLYGIKSLQLLDSDTFSVSNIKNTLSDENVSINIQYRNTQTDIPDHNEWLLVNENQSEKITHSLIKKKLFDSIVGFDTEGNSVPDTALPTQKKYGLQIRPRQSMFINRLDALKILLKYTNDLIAQHRIVDEKDISKLFTTDAQPISTSGKYDKKVDDFDDLAKIKTNDLIQASVSPVIVNGRIKSITIDNPGYGYEIAPEIEIIAVNGKGCKLKSNIDSQGKLSSVEVLKEGRDYTTPTLLIRPFTVLVDVDATANNYWSLYQWNNAESEWIRTVTQTFDLTRFWTYKDYKVSDFDTDSIIDFKLESTYQLKTIQPVTGQLVQVENSGDGNRIILRKVDENGSWSNDYDLVFKKNATIEFSDRLYNYNVLSFGYAGEENFDTNLFDEQPTTETRLILETLLESIFVDDLKYAWNKFVFIAIRYALSEQPFADWIFKTSLISIKNSLGGFSTKINYNLDDPGNVENYIKEVKPYASTIKDIVTAYDNLETSNMMSTDFDLPSRYDDETEKFVTVNETDAIVTSSPWNQWFENYKFQVSEIKISDQGEGYEQAPIIVISGGREQKPNIVQTTPFRELVTTDYNNTYVYVNTTSVPDHFYNSPNVKAQNFVYQIPRFPAVPEVKVPTPLGAIGVAINGVSIFNPKAAEVEILNGVTYQINAPEVEQLAVDDGGGHPQEDGVYHYHSDPKLMYTKDETKHSQILGFAFDGFPIYGPYGYKATNDLTITLMRSSYRLKTTPRPDATMPTGRYVEDYEYIAGLGDLDENNGRFIRTPEYPNGTYAYFVTVDPNDVEKAVYPYIVGPNFHGTPLLPNGQGTMPQSDNINATATAFISRNKLGTIVLENPGAGYTSAPTVTVTGGGNNVTKTARVVAVLENKKVRTGKTEIKFDRTSKSKIQNTLSYTDSYTANEGQIRYNLTYVPTLDKRDFEVTINNESVYLENFAITIESSKENRTYQKQTGSITLQTLPKAGDVVTIKYKKNVNLLNALDRIDYLYSPTDGMPGKDPSQLMTGVDYAGVSVQGLEFSVSVGFDGLPWFSHGWDTFSGDNSDYAFRADGSTTTFTLPYAPQQDVKVNVYFDSVRQDPTNTPTIVGDGNTKEFTINVTAPDGTLVIFRPEDSDGSVAPTDVNNLDTIIQGGNFAYTTATGNKPEDISLDGDDFVTPDTSYAPEEVIPGQTFDTLAMKVYNSPADGSPIIITNRYHADGNTSVFNFDQLPGTDASYFVTVEGQYKTDSEYTIDYNAKTITFPSNITEGNLVTIQTLNVAGTKILERKSFIGDGSTTEFLLTARFEDVKSAFVTVNGIKRDYVIRDDVSETRTGSAIIDVVNPPVASGDVVQIVALSGVDRTFSEIKKTNIVTDGNTTEYRLNETPGNIEPFHAMVVVEMDGQRLRAPDTIYYVANGVQLSYPVSEDPAYPNFSLALGELEVHQNGKKLIPITDFQFDTSTNLITFQANKLSAGDVIAVTILRNHDYEIIKDTDDDSTAAGKIILRRNSNEDSTGYEAGKTITITTFTNHDANLMRKEVFKASSGGNYILSRKVIDSNYVWVELDGTPLVADLDYKILDDGKTVYIDNRFQQSSTSHVVITSFSEEISYEPIGYMVFKDMMDRRFYKRISNEDSVLLSTDLNISDSEIVINGQVDWLDTPSIENLVPGVLMVDRERIEYYKQSYNSSTNKTTISQITRGTLGTGSPDVHKQGTKIMDAGIKQTMPYTDNTNAYEVVIREGLPNGKSVHVLETINFTSSANAHDQVEVYVGGRKLQKPTTNSNPITKHSIDIAFDSNETNSAGTSSDVVQVPEFTIEPVTDSTVKGFYKLTLRDEPANGTEVKVIQRTGKVWYNPGTSTPSNGETLQRAETTQAKFLLERTSGLPVINIKE